MIFMVTPHLFAAPFFKVAGGEPFMEGSDVSDAVIFKFEQLVSSMPAINLRADSIVLFETHVPFQTLPLAREESEQTCQDGLELTPPFRIFEHKLRSVRRSSEGRVPRQKYIDAQRLFDSWRD